VIGCLCSSSERGIRWFEARVCERKSVRRLHPSRYIALKALGPLAHGSVRSPFATQASLRSASLSRSLSDISSLRWDRGRSGDYSEREFRESELSRPPVRFAHGTDPRPFDPPGTAQHRDRRPHSSPPDCAAHSVALLIHWKTHSVRLPGLRSLRSRRPRATPPRDETLGGARHRTDDSTQTEH